MDYMITFSDVMATVITLGLGVIGFFMKRWISDVEQGNKALQQALENTTDSLNEKIEQGNRDIQEKIQKNDEKVNERINKLEENTGKDIQHIKQEINDIKGDFATTFVLREDFFRSMNGVEDKIGKLEKYFTPETEIIVTLSVEKQRQKIEVTVPVKGHTIRAEQSSDNMYVSIDLVEEIIVRQLRKYKTRIANQQNSRKNFQPAYLEMETDGDEEVKIVRTKKFAIKPLDPEEACVEMELLGHSFFVFRNAQTNEVNVVYKRKGNTYGLIEPEN